MNASCRWGFIKGEITIFAIILTVLLGSSGNVWGQSYQLWPASDANYNPKIQRVLAGLVAEARAGHAIQETLLYLQDETGSSFHDRYAVLFDENRIEVVIEAATPEAVSEVSQKVRSLDGQTETTYENLIQALVPLDRLEALAEHSDVRFVRLPVRPYTDQIHQPAASSQSSGRILSEGLTTTNSLAWNEADFKGNGIKLGIVDVGFLGYSGQLGRELPPSDKVITRSFRSDRDLECRECEREEAVHGLGVAEIINDIAPESTFYLVNAQTDVEFRQAFNYVIQQDVDVINTSIGNYSGCFRAGGGMYEPIIAQARDQGITWVTASSNEGDVHYQSTFQDANSNGVHDFAAGDDNVTFDVMPFQGTVDGQPAAIASFEFILSWDALCTGASDDYDIEIYPEGAASVRIEGDWYWSPGVPIKLLSGFFYTTNLSTLDTPLTLNLVIKKKADAAPARLDLIISDYCANCIGGETQYLTPVGSVSIVEPSISPNAISVGAAHHTAGRCPRSDCPDGRLLIYSSQGPTKDGRTKPDIAAFTNVSTSAYGTFTGFASSQNIGFNGTSAATPHVAGASALVIQALRAQGQNPDMDDVKQFLSSRAEDFGPNGNDNLYGAGLLFLGQPPAIAPTIIGIDPGSGLQGGSVAAQISGTGLSAATAVTFSGSGVTATISSGGNATTLPVLIAIAANAEPGARTFTVTTPGGTSESGAVTFTVTQAPVIRVSPESLTFTATVEGSNPASQTLQITNTGGGTLNWTAAVSADAEWLSANPTTGTAPGEVQVSANIADLMAGEYTGQITFTEANATNSPVIVSVRLTINPAAPKASPLQASPANLTFEAVAGGENPAPLDLQITNRGNAQATWSVSVSAENGSWLRVSTVDSDTVLDPNESTTLNVSADITGLPEGTYKGQLAFTTEGFEPLVVLVTLKLTAQTQPSAGVLVALVFKTIEFVTPGDWERTQREGCVVYKNVSAGPSLIRVTLPDDSVKEFAIAADNEVIVCGDVAHIDTR